MCGEMWWQAMDLNDDGEVDEAEFVAFAKSCVAGAAAEQRATWLLRTLVLTALA